MNLRLANINDIPKLKIMYRKIIDNMNKNNILICDEYYPCKIFNDDIKNNRLYLLEEEHSDIVTAFVLCKSNIRESFVK